MEFRITWHLPKNSGQEPGYFWKVTSPNNNELELWAKECHFDVPSKTGANHIECEGMYEMNTDKGVVYFYNTARPSI
jgi:hypothetical protein